MQELQRIWENVHLAEKKGFDFPRLFSPPNSPLCPPATDLQDACLGLDLLCFKFPGNLALALPRGRVLPASQAWGLRHRGQRAGSPPMLRPGPAAPAGSSPDTPKCSPTASAGLQGGLVHPRPRMCPCTSTGAEQSAAFGQPAGSRTPSQLLPGDCQQQGAGGTEDPSAMSLPFLPGGTDAGRHTGAQGAAPAGTSPCSLGARMAPGGCLLAPHTLAPKPRSHRRLQAASSPGLAMLQPPPL